MKKNISIKKIAHLTGHDGGIFTLTESGADHLFLSGAGDGWIVEWDLKNPKDGRLIAQAEDTQVNRRASVFALLKIQNDQAENELILAGNMNGGLHWIYPKDTSKNIDILHHKKGVFDIQLIDNQLFTVGGEGVLTKWGIDSGRTLESLHLSAKSLRTIAFFSAKNEMAIGGSDGNIYFINVKDFTLKRTIENAHDNSVFTLKYTSDGKTLWSGGRDAHLKIWDLENDDACISTAPAHWFTINAIVFSPDGKLAATGSRDKTIKIWDTSNFKLLKVLDTARDGGHINSVNTLLWSTYNNWLISGSDDRSIIIWEMEY